MNILVDAVIEPNEKAESGSERERVRDYAQKLRKEGYFLSIVLFDVALALYQVWNRRLDPKLWDSYTIDRDLQLRLEEHLKEYLEKTEFWEKGAECILSQLDAWNRDEKTPDFPHVMPFGVWHFDPDLPGDIASKEKILRDSCATAAAYSLLQQLDLPNRSFDFLEDLLLPKPEIAKINVAKFKLSQLQKKILLRLFDETKENQDRVVQWTPAKLFGEQTDAERAALSRALKRLENRFLIVRQSTKNGQTAERTTKVQLTELGRRMIKRLTIEADRNS